MYPSGHLGVLELRWELAAYLVVCFKIPPHSSAGFLSLQIYSQLQRHL